MEELIEEHFVKIRECEKRIRDIKNELQFWGTCSLQVILLRSLLDDEYDRMATYILSSKQKSHRERGREITAYLNGLEDRRVCEREKRIIRSFPRERRCSL